MKNITVLAVDDIEANRISLQYLIDEYIDNVELLLASSGEDALKITYTNDVDIIILDIQMPRQDGISYLKEVMKSRPTPVVICSSVAVEGSKDAVEALFLGATEVIHKPRMDVEEFFQESRAVIVNAIKSAYSAKKNVKNLKSLVIEKKENPDVILPCCKRKVSLATEKIIAIGASTGGVQAIEEVLKTFSPKTPGTVIVQHMPSGFTSSFANRLNSICDIQVKEACDGDEISVGFAYVAPGDKHLLIHRNEEKYYIEIKDGPKVSRHKPSVDVMFRSVANEAGRNAVGVILTGMGDDGAIGMKELRDSGAKTIAQDEKTSVVFGMPKEAIALGGIDFITPLEEIGKKILEVIK